MDLPRSQMRPEVLRVLMNCKCICEPQNPTESAVTGAFRGISKISAHFRMPHLDRPSLPVLLPFSPRND